MSTPDIGAVVVGVGIAGLAAALELQGRVGEVVVVDASDRPGGVMRTDHVAGYVIERGPNTFQVDAPMLELLRRFGAEGDLLPARPASRLRFIFHRGRLVPIPLSPLAFVRTPLLSVRGKLRLLVEPLARRRDASGESVAEFAGRRLGAEAVANLVGPFLTGVYAGDEERLGAEAVFGSLVELERRYGSLAIGVLARSFRRRERGLRGSYSSGDGLGPFARRLTERLVEPPALGTRATALRREDGSWHLSLSSPAGERALRTSRLVLATPAPEAAQLLRAVSAEAAQALAGIEYAPIVALPLGVDPDQLRATIEGFGFLAPRASGLSLLGCLFMSRLFPSRAPEGRELLHCMLGGTRWPEAVEEPDDLLLERCQSDLDRALGLRGAPQCLAVTRWPRAIPQPGRDHVRRIAAVRRELAERGGIALAGGYLAGVSVGDTFVSGLRAAREVAPGA